MRKLIITSTLLAAISITGTSFADGPPPSYTPYHPDISRELSVNNHLRIGIGAGFGFPSGGSVDLTVHPFVDWLRLQGSATYNYLSVGYKFGVQLDPINMLLPDSGVGLFGDLQYGVSPMSSIPGQTNMPNVGYTYTCLFGGLRLGNAKSFHWDIEAGYGWIAVNTTNFQSVLNNNANNNVKVADPTATIQGAPTFLTGFEIPITF